MKYAVMIAALLLPSTAFAQHQGHDSPAEAPSPVDHNQMDHGAMEDGDEIVLACSRKNQSSSGSGTSRLPGNGDGHAGLHKMSGDWMIMAHGYAWAAYSDQGGPRGAKKTFVQSMAMVEAKGPIANGVNLQLRTMLSLDPLMGDSGYPNLFASGETAGGNPLVDRQHPHDFFMELSARVDVDTNFGSVFVYGGPVAEPALGPSAFMHRGSSRLNPEAPITHHWFDSTHISFGVVTVGVASRKWQLEGSAFRGREPDERRWNIENPKFDSWSVRASWNPSPAWAAQVSYGHIKEPEALHPGEDEGRFTSSLSYTARRLNVTGAFSAKNRKPGETLTAWLLEANYDMTKRHAIFGRFENVKNDELFSKPLDPLHDTAFRVSKFTGGYGYTIPVTSNVNLAVGGSASVYAKPSALDIAYGKSPVSFTVFAKLSLGH
ncbi:MAG: hypothetical protein ABL918_08195 [Chakrabartia sp.]